MKQNEISHIKMETAMHIIGRLYQNPHIKRYGDKVILYSEAFK